MILDKKTSNKIMELILESDSEKFKNKVWVSQESLIKTFNKFFNHGNEREMIILNAILKDLDIPNKKLNEEKKHE